MTSLATWAARQPNRCPNGYDLTTQHPGLCDCQRAAARKASGIAAINGATPIDVKARIDAAIRKWRRRGGSSPPTTCATSSASPAPWSADGSTPPPAPA